MILQSAINRCSLNKASSMLLTSKLSCDFTVMVLIIIINVNKKHPYTTNPIIILDKLRNVKGIVMRTKISFNCTFSNKKIQTAPSKAMISPARFSKLCFLFRSVSYSLLTISKYSSMAVSPTFGSFGCSIVSLFSIISRPLFYIITLLRVFVKT